jgi:hypothetical protein
LDKPAAFTFRIEACNKKYKYLERRDKGRRTERTQEGSKQGGKEGETEGKKKWREGRMEDRSQSFKCFYGGPRYLSLSSRLTFLP